MLRTAMGPLIAAALDDPDVVEILLNPDGALWLDRLSSGRAQLARCPPPMASGLSAWSRRISARKCTGASPCSARSCRTPASVSRVLPPVAAGPTFALRKRAAGVIPLEQYVADGILTAWQAEYLRGAVRSRQNILVAGGTSTGKTTLANALIAEVASTGDRVLVLEDTVELQCPSSIMSPCAPDPVWCPWPTWCVPRCACVPTGWWSAKCAAARLDLVKAWGTGHPGGIATLHAGSAQARCCAWNN